MHIITRNILLAVITIFLLGSLRAQSSAGGDSFNYVEKYSKAQSLYETGNVDEAVRIHYLILDFLQKNNDGSKEYFSRLTKSYQDLCNLYIYKNDSLSLSYANKAITSAEKTHDNKLLNGSYTLKYYCLYDVKGKAQELNTIADSCIKFSLGSGDKKALSMAYINKFNALVELGKEKEGEEYEHKAVELFAEADTGYFLSSVFCNIANVYVKSNQLEKALSYHLKAYDISKGQNNLSNLLIDIQNIAEDYYDMSNYQKAAKFFRMLSDSMDASYQHILDEKFTDSEAKFNAAQKDKEIALQKLNIAQQKQARNKIIFGGLVIFFLVIGFFQWYLYKYRKKKQLAEQELLKEHEINIFRQRFLENVAHEIRTPITLIGGHLSLALDTINDKKSVERHINSAIKSSQKVLDNANEILELQKLEKGKQPVQNSKFTLNSFLKRVFYSFESLAKLKKINLKYHSNIKPEITIQSDKNRIEKILNNFISNAIKFSPSNSNIVFDANYGQGSLIIKVTDSGPGISIDEQKKIFNRFYQSPKTSSVGGVGVGLALANELAKSLGGIVSVESKEGSGSTFVFKIDVETKISKHIEDISKDTKPDALTIDINIEDKPKLLIVEDNPEMNAYLKEILSKQFSCDIAFDGIEGLQKVQKNKYNLIVSDVMMPHVDGFELKKHINSLSHKKNIPFIFVTAKAQLHDKVDGFNMGVDDYITKPFVKEELLARIGNLLHNKKERDKWAKNNADFVDNNKNTEEQLLEKVKSVVRNKLSDENFTVAELAEEVAYSSRQLSRLVKKHIGLTPLQFVLEMRLQKAYTCLAGKKFSTISEVRNYVGMPSAANFNKKFFERFGIKASEVLNL